MTPFEKRKLAFKTFKLYPRQLQTVCYVLSGLSNKEIGEKMGVAEKSIKSTLGDIFKKIGVKNKLELFSWYVDKIEEGYVFKKEEIKIIVEQPLIRSTESVFELPMGRSL